MVVRIWAHDVRRLLGKPLRRNPAWWDLGGLCNSEQEALYFQKSLGFVRLAMEQGRPILACYSFGENQLFRSWGGHGLRLWVARKLRIGLPYFHGKWNLPNGNSPDEGDIRRWQALADGYFEPNGRRGGSSVRKVPRRDLRLFKANAPFIFPDIAGRGDIAWIRHGEARGAQPLSRGFCRLCSCVCALHPPIL